MRAPSSGDADLCVKMGVLKLRDSGGGGLLLWRCDINNESSAQNRKSYVRESLGVGACCYGDVVYTMSNLARTGSHMTESPGVGACCYGDVVYTMSRGVKKKKGGGDNAYILICEGT